MTAGLTFFPFDEITCLTSGVTSEYLSSFNDEILSLTLSKESTIGKYMSERFGFGFENQEKS